MTACRAISDFSSRRRSRGRQPRTTTAQERVQPRPYYWRVQQLVQAGSEAPTVEPTILEARHAEDDAVVFRRTVYEQVNLNSVFTNLSSRMHVNIVWTF